MLSLRKSASAMNLRKTDRSELNLFPALSFLVVCFIGGYFLWATKDALPSEADNTDFRYAPSRAKELAQELDSIYSCKSGPGMEEFPETWHRKYTSNASAPDNQNDTLRNVYNLFTTLFNPDPTLRPRFTSVHGSTRILHREPHSSKKALQTAICCREQTEKAYGRPTTGRQVWALWTLPTRMRLNGIPIN